jgi:hypothetical protein
MQNKIYIHTYKVKLVEFYKLVNLIEFVLISKCF